MRGTSEVSCEKPGFGERVGSLPFTGHHGDNSLFGSFCIIFIVGFALWA